MIKGNDRILVIKSVFCKKLISLRFGKNKAYLPLFLTTKVTYPCVLTYTTVSFNDCFQDFRI